MTICNNFFALPLLVVALVMNAPIGQARPAKKPPLSAYESGKQSALRDLKHGVMVYKNAGLTYANDPFYLVLWERYHIKNDGYGCVMTPSQEANLRGYNSVMRPAIEKKFGRNIWKLVTKQADAIRTQQYVSCPPHPEVVIEPRIISGTGSTLGLPFSPRIIHVKQINPSVDGLNQGSTAPMLLLNSF